MKKLLILLIALVTNQMSYSMGKLGSFKDIIQNPILKGLKLFALLATGAKTENSGQEHCRLLRSTEGQQYDKNDKLLVSIACDAEQFLQKASKLVEGLFKEIHDKSSNKDYTPDLSTLENIITPENIHMKTATGKSILHLVVQREGDYFLFPDQIEHAAKIIQLFIGFGLDINTQDCEGKTALHLDPELGLAKLLLEKGLNPNIRNNMGRTVFFEAINNGTLGIARLLLKYGADANIADVNGENAYFNLIKYDKSEILRIGSFLSEINLDVNKQNVNGSTVLHKAVTIGQFDLVKFLVTIRSIDVNIKDSNGLTPLDYAMALEQKEIVSLLKLYKARHDSEI